MVLTRNNWAELTTKPNYVSTLSIPPIVKLTINNPLRTPNNGGLLGPPTGYG